MHLNPVRAGLVSFRKGKGLLDYRWSSLAQGYGITAAKRPRWMAVEETLAIFGWKDDARGRRAFVERLEERANEEGRQKCGKTLPEGQSLQSTLERGWYWGSQEFREKLVERMKKPRNRSQRGHSSAQDHERKAAETILRDGARHFGLKSDELSVPARATQRARVAIAWALTRRTSQRQQWIADHLGLRNGANVSQQTRQFPILSKKLSKEFQTWMKYVNI